MRSPGPFGKKRAKFEELDLATKKDRISPRGPEALVAHFVASGYRRAEPAILQPAAVFLDQSGEDIRGRLYLTSDLDGAEMCLRPEFTVPVCRDYLASAEAGKPAAFSYLGPIFRFRPGASGEFAQAGVESFGRADREAADADILGVAMEACALAGADKLKVTIGDAALFSSFLDALELPAGWLRRLKTGLAQGRALETIFTQSAAGSAADHSGVLAALEGVDKQGARALVEDLLSIAGISSVGGRSAGEIAERFLEQASHRSAPQISDAKRDLIGKFLAVSGDPDEASAKLRKLAKTAKLDLSAALDSFDTRINFIAARGLDPSAMAFSAGFARRLDYYTGFVFEAHDRARKDGKPVVGGGRYDTLLGSLGAKKPIPAVGAAVWIERLCPGVQP